MEFKKLKFGDMTQFGVVVKLYKARVHTYYTVVSEEDTYTEDDWGNENITCSVIRDDKIT